MPTAPATSSIPPSASTRSRTTTSPSATARPTPAGACSSRPTSMPRNASGVPIDPTEWNRNDGFSPGSADPHGASPASTSSAPAPRRVTDIGRSLRASAPIVLLDADHRASASRTGPSSTPARAERRPALLVVRPAVNFPRATASSWRCDDLQDAAGKPIEPRPTRSAPTATARQTSDPDHRGAPAAHAGRAQRRSTAPASSATTSFSPGTSPWPASTTSPSGCCTSATTRFDVPRQTRRPRSQVTQVENRRRRAASPAGCRAPSRCRTTSPATAVPATGSHTRPERPRRRRNGDYTAPFTCIIPRAALKPDGTVARARPRGLRPRPARQRARGRGRQRARHGERAQLRVLRHRSGSACREEDIGNAVSVARRPLAVPDHRRPAPAGRAELLFLGRAMIDRRRVRVQPGVPGTGHAADRPARAVLRRQQPGRHHGRRRQAVSQDWTRAVLGVPGDELQHAAPTQHRLRHVQGDLRPAPTRTRPTASLILGIVQMLWDRGEANGYAQHLTGDPYPDTPNHQVLMHVAFGDHQVANVATEVEARTLGARVAPPRARRRPVLRPPSALGDGGARGPVRRLGASSCGTAAPRPRPPATSPPRDGRGPARRPARVEASAGAEVRLPQTQRPGGRRVRRPTVQGDAHALTSSAAAYPSADLRDDISSCSRSRESVQPST